jgi:hypothetical protein
MRAATLSGGANVLDGAHDTLHRALDALRVCELLGVPGRLVDPSLEALDDRKRRESHDDRRTRNAFAKLSQVHLELACFAERTADLADLSIGFGTVFLAQNASPERERRVEPARGDTQVVNRLVVRAAPRARSRLLEHGRPPADVGRKSGERENTPRMEQEVHGRRRGSSAGGATPGEMFAVSILGPTISRSARRWLSMPETFSHR